MPCKIIAATVPEADLDIGTTDDLVAFCARVSNPDNQMNNLTSGKLLSYLIRKKHWSPFEMVDCVMEISTPRDIARQALRHGSFKFQEFSQRYADPTSAAGMGFTIREARLQDPKNRQNSVELDWDNQEHCDLEADWEFKQSEVIRVADEAYQWAISKGVAKECARVVLPEGLTMSRLYMKGSLRSWYHYAQVRTEQGVQKEHRELANEVWLAIQKRFPAFAELDFSA